MAENRKLTNEISKGMFSLGRKREETNQISKKTPTCTKNKREREEKNERKRERVRVSERERVGERGRKKKENGKKVWKRLPVLPEDL